MNALLKERPAPGARFTADAPEADPGADEVLIEVAATSVCGTDVHLHEWSASARAFSPTLPLIFGHETAGVVVATGADVAHRHVGDRVAVETHVFCGACFPCRTGNAHVCERMELFGLTRPGAFAQRVAVPERVCFLLPDEVELETAALFEPAGVAVRALERAGDLNGASVLVCGCGPIGLMLVELCRAVGAARILATEPNAAKRARAAELGAIALDPTADDVARACRHASRRGGVDVAFECSAASGVLATMLEAIRPEGTAVTVGHPGEATPIDVAAFINKKGITLRGVFGRGIWSSWETLVELVVSGRFALDAHIAHRLALDEFERALELVKSEPGKVVLVP
ncbi:MAG: threonine 3-dehydrogenase [Solirubrobacteraceae bacterium]